MNPNNQKNYRKVEKPLSEFKAAIDSLNLDALDVVIRKSKPRVSNELLEIARQRYKNFLYLCGATGEVIVPTPMIDVVWHAHILDTVKYAEDCQRTFGFFFHHYPYFGLLGDKADLDAAYERSKQIYEAHFGEAYEIEIAARDNDELADIVYPDNSCG